jgi:hypothetical protein
MSPIAGSSSLFSEDIINLIRDVSAGLPSSTRIGLAADLQLIRTGRLVRSTTDSCVQCITLFLTELTGHGKQCVINWSP